MFKAEPPEIMPTIEHELVDGFASIDQVQARADIWPIGSALLARGNAGMRVEIDGDAQIPHPVRRCFSEIDMATRLVPILERHAELDAASQHFCMDIGCAMEGRSPERQGDAKMRMGGGRMGAACLLRHLRPFDAARG